MSKILLSFVILKIVNCLKSLTTNSTFILLFLLKINTLLKKVESMKLHSLKSMITGVSALNDNFFKKDNVERRVSWKQAEAQG